MDVVPKIELDARVTLMVSEIGEPSNNDLRVVVVQAAPLTTTVNTSLGEAHPILPDPSRPAMELTWFDYVAYSVRNESYFRPEEGETVGKGPFGERVGSAYLAYVAATTFAGDAYPGPLRHWYLYTDWHCIDVVSVAPPELRYLDPAETARHLSEGTQAGERG